MDENCQRRCRLPLKPINFRSLLMLANVTNTPACYLSFLLEMELEQIPVNSEGIATLNKIWSTSFERIK